MGSNSICMSLNVIKIQKELNKLNENVPIIQPFCQLHVDGLGLHERYCDL